MLSLPSVEDKSAKTRSDVAAVVVDRRKSDLRPLDAQLDAGGCKADIDPRHG